jgi:hypothetical protein
VQQHTLVVEVEQPKVMEHLLLLELVELVVVVQAVNQILLLQQVLELTELITLEVAVVELQMTMDPVEQQILEVVVQVSWLREHQELQEFILQHVVHVHRLHQPMEQIKLQNLKHQQI